MESTEQETVTAIFKEAGWTAGTRDGWDGKFIWKGTNVVGGIDPWGTPRTTGIVDNPNEGPTTREDAARWLVEHAKALRLEPTPPMFDLTTEATLEPPEVVNETFPVEPEAAAIAEVEGLFPAGEAEYGGEHETHGETGEKAAEDIHEPAWVHDEAGGHAESVFSGAEAGPVAYDADFEAFGEPEALEAEAAAEPLALPEGLELGEDIVAAEDEAAPSVAYFGDNIHTIRLAKMGRLSQRARELKATLQQGWTLERFAYLQNLIVRIDRKEAPDDDAARAEFLAINERSAAMARVDAYRELREAELEAADRAGVEAFDPEAGWP